LMAALRDQKTAQEIGLGKQSRVLVINTEGATDPGMYHQIVGSTTAEVMKRHST
jgi:diaminopropionate ammonia-lyase